ncbi:hypothetical protein [Foetidibacter luteolus]|uniref:hypothetical protein n=1 Tax=Foetidibacter luteolus TaxID=2608880 RepID=UPI00129BB496|nr:hypothetical protein [Foetidibacter luteolus]
MTSGIRTLQFEKMPAKICLFLVLLVSVNITFAQNPVKDQRYIPPSPNAMVFQKYVDFPVDLSTGVPQISIPIYNISLNDYSFPITASFHASGRKAELNFSPLGMNWSLLATGVINREVRGLPDGNGYYHLEKTDAQLSPQNDHYNELISIDPTGIAYNTSVTKMDNEYDIYTISLNGISAKFINRDNVGVVFLTYCPYKVTFSGTSTITVIDDKGITYKFGSENGYGFNEFSNEANGTTSWFINNITTSSGRLIRFKYNSQSIQPSSWIGRRTYGDLLAVNDAGLYNTNCIYLGGSGESTFNGYYQQGVSGPNGDSYQNYGISYIKEIEFDNGKITFEYSNTSTEFLLQTCTITTDANALVKTVKFSYFDYIPGTNLFLANNNSRTIKDITFIDKGNQEIEKYSFEYYPGQNGGTQPDFAKRKDWWGYCNTLNYATSGTRQIPIQSFGVQQAGGTSTFNTGGTPNDKIASFNAKLPGMIKKITYPTGGTTELTYEPNKIYDWGGNLVDGPGLRIQKILSDDGYGNTKAKTYEYAGAFVIRYPLVYDYFSSKKKMYVIEGSNNQAFQADYMGSYRYRIYSSDANPEVQASLNHPVYYSSVTEKDFSGGGINNGRTIYTYTFPTYFATPQSVSFPAGNYQGANVGSGSSDDFEVKVFNFDEWSMPLLSTKTVQRYNAQTSEYKTVTFTQMDYVTFKELNIPQVSLYKNLEFPIASNGQYQKLTMTDQRFNWQVYTLLDKTIKTAIKKLDKETTTTYDANDNPLSSYTKYYYDNLNHLNPTRIETKGSDDNLLTKYTLYPQDYATGTAFIANLISKNMLSAPIEEVSLRKIGSTNKIVSGKISTYSGTNVDWVYKLESAASITSSSFKFSNRALGSVYPSGSAGVYSPDSKYKPFSKFEYDAKNNPQNILPEDQMPTSLIWAHNGAYPIAEAKNATNAQIAYSSFESSDQGNWEYSGTVTRETTESLMPPTGESYYAVTATKPIKKTGLPVNAKVIVSYWRNSSQPFTVTGSTSIITGLTANGWTYFEHKVTVPSSQIVQIDGSGLIDEVRLYPENALMSSYTYKPLTGMTSEADNKGQIMTYTYDNYSRLSNIKNSFRNVVQKFDYKFANVPGGSGGASVYAKIFYTNYFNDVDMTTATIIIGFFSDPGCTQPLSVNNLNVNYKKVRTTCSGTSPLETFYSATCNGTQTSLGNQIISMDDGVHCYNYQFLLLAGTGYSPQ